MARLHHRHQFRLALCGHKAVETGAVCLALMVQGHIAAITLGHLGLASKTGLLAVAPVLVLTLTRYARHLANRWTASAFLAMCAFAADAVVHESHYPGELTEAALRPSEHSGFRWRFHTRRSANTSIVWPNDFQSSIRHLVCHRRRSDLIEAVRSNSGRLAD